jgi:hypothetical protein
VMTQGGQLLPLILVTQLSVIGMAALSFPLARRKHPQLQLNLRAASAPLIRVLLANSAFFFLYNLGLLFQRMTGSLLAGRFAPLEMVAPMFLVLTIFRVAGWYVADTLSQVVLPYFILKSVRESWNSAVFLARLFTKLTVVVACSFAAVTWVTGEFAIKKWLGPQMFAGSSVLILLGSSYLLDAYFISTNNFMRALNRHHGLAVVMAAYAIACLVLGAVFAQVFAARPLFGIALGFFTASVCTQATALPILTRRFLGIGWSHYLWDFLLRPGMLVLLALACAYASDLVKDACVRPALGAIILPFFPLIGWFAVLSADERSWLSSRLRRSLRTAA